MEMRRWGKDGLFELKIGASSKRNVKKELMEKGKINRKEIEELLRQSDIENKGNEKVENDKPVKLKQASKGIIAFLTVHLLFEILLSIDMGESKFVFKSLFLSVFLNFFIAYHYVKWRIGRNTVSQHQNLFNYGVKVSLTVFILRVLLGLFIFLT
jgi:hypothetical protein